MSDPLLLIGCGGHARSLIDVVETSGRWHVLGLVGLPSSWERRCWAIPY